MTYTIASMGGKPYLEEKCYATAMELIAAGEDVEGTRTVLLREFPELEGPALADLMWSAAHDYMRGADEYDYDGTWRNR
jgi:hypothetical protein